jgi:hypothetical protein
MRLRRRDDIKVYGENSGTPVLPQVNANLMLVHYVNVTGCYFFNKTRRLFVARSKRVLRDRKVASAFWVKIGRLSFICKKAKNSRMGGGTGTFFSVRRFMEGGSAMAKYKSFRRGLYSIVINNLRRKLPTLVKVFVICKMMFSLFNTFKNKLSSSSVLKIVKRGRRSFRRKPVNKYKIGNRSIKIHLKQKTVRATFKSRRRIKRKRIFRLLFKEMDSRAFRRKRMRITHLLTRLHHPKIALLVDLSRVGKYDLTAWDSYSTKCYDGWTHS